MIFFTVLQDVESLTLLSSSFQIFGNIVFGNNSRALIFGLWFANFTTLCDDIGLKICLNEGGVLSKNIRFTKSAM